MQQCKLANPSEGYKAHSKPKKASNYVEYYSPPNNKTMLKTNESWGPSPSERPGGAYDMNRLSETKTYNMQMKSPNGGVTNQQYNETIIPLAEPLYFCNDEVNADSNFAIGMNQRLVGQANPKTLIPPVVKPPSWDLDYWRDNELITFSAINSEPVQEEMYLSGYADSTCCGYLDCGAELVPTGSKQVKTVVGGGIPPYTENYQNDTRSNIRENQPGAYECPSSGQCTQIRAPVPVVDNPFAPVVDGSRGLYSEIARQGVNRRNNLDNSFVNENYGDGNQSNPRENYQPGAYTCPNSGPCTQIRAPVPVVDNPFAPVVDGSRGLYSEMGSNNMRNNLGNSFVNESYSRRQGRDIKENYTPLTTDPNAKMIRVQPNHSGWVNTACGYNPDQVFTAGLPSNLPAGNCEQSPLLKQYNTNLHTQTVTPGVYTRSQVNEPINANIGISFQQQFEPVTCRRDENGLHYLQHDPRIIEPAFEDEPIEPVPPKANYDNVYDPRFYGYGTSYRSYEEPVTGQTRFMYDDINAIRMPNYLTRNKLDHLPYADTYGPMVAGSEDGNIHNPYIRALAQDSWMRDSLQFRNDMTERRMRKVNSEMWQRRQYPLGPRQV